MASFFRVYWSRKGDGSMCHGMQNMGRHDRVWRFFIGILTAVLALLQVGGAVGRDLFILLAVVLVGTSLTGFCAIYRLLGWRTCNG